MASKALVTSLLTLNLMFITMVSSCPSCPPSTPPPPPSPTPKSPITPTVPTTPCPPPPSSFSQGYCPIDALMLGVCANVLNMFNVTVGSPPTIPCCSLITGLIDLEAAACLCTALKANVLGINLNIRVSLSLILNNCGKNNSAFQCN